MNLQERAREILKRKQRALAERIASELQDATPVRSGRMKKSWRVVENGEKVQIENTAPYAKIVAKRNGFIDEVLKKYH